MMQKCRCMAVSQQNFIISRQQSMSFVLLNWKLKTLNMMSCEELAVRWIEIQCNTQVQLNQLADTNFFLFLNFLYCTRLSQFSNDSSFTVFKRGPILFLVAIFIVSLFERKIWWYLWKLWICDLMGTEWEMAYLNLVSSSFYCFPDLV